MKKVCLKYSVHSWTMVFFPLTNNVSFSSEDLTNDHNYLNNLKNIAKKVRGACKDTKLCFSLLICRKDLKDIDKKVIKASTHLENLCKQQNLDFIDNSNIKKSDLNSRGLHLIVAVVS